MVLVWFWLCNLPHFQPHFPHSTIIACTHKYIICHTAWYILPAWTTMALPRILFSFPSSREITLSTICTWVGWSSEAVKMLPRSPTCLSVAKGCDASLFNETKMLAILGSPWFFWKNMEIFNFKPERKNHVGWVKLVSLLVLMTNLSAKNGKKCPKNPWCHGF